ncbi:MAG: cytochrome c oxidase subunit 3 [Candidatus Eisenbacteria bacterium]
MSDHSDHPSYLGHHYDTVEQQFDSGKLGMWLFLATEILLFAGLFCAYAIYRKNHPEVFIYAHQFLDKQLGGINTLVLITSSFTMAMAVRMAQLGKKQATAGLLALTLLGGVGFLGIKAVEYEHKWKHGLLWGTKYRDQDAEHAAPGEHGGEHGTDGEAAPGEHSLRLGLPGVEVAHAAEDAGHGAAGSEAAADGEAGAGGADHAASGDAAAAGAETHAADGTMTEAAATGAEGIGDESLEPAPIIGGEAMPRSGLAHGASQPQGMAAPAEAGEGHGTDHKPSNVHIFFGIYFLMTGLHGLHVIAGMGAISWVLVRTLRGDFSAEYSTPVDLVGLYWHLVDLVWIYLFPLLYLIH